MSQPHTDHDTLRPHEHDPNLTPPSGDPGFTLALPNRTEMTITLADLKALPKTTLPDCYIVSTGHGTSGPFSFTGARLLDLIQSRLPAGLAWSQVEVISADGFGNRIMAAELFEPDPAGPMVLSYIIDGQAMTREEGLVRLIVPSEKDDALRQVKWVGRINVLEG
jgi:Oxidoreductase molybdopterin binding domain